MAAVLGTRFERSEKDAFQERARLLHTRIEGRRAPHRSGPRSTGQPLRRLGRRLREGERRVGAAGEGLPVPAFGSTRRPAPRALLPGRSVRDAAAHFEHVSPISCALPIAAWSKSNYISGDTWNVNPIALQTGREIVLQERTGGHSLPPAVDGALMTLVPVAAILVASMRLKFLDVPLHLRYRGPNVIPCDARMRKGAKKWAGSSTAQPSSCSPRGALASTMACRRDAAFRWARR